MSRHGYIEDGCCYDREEQWQSIMWRGRVTSATRGKRGQAMLKDLAEALDAMPVKELISGHLVKEGECCAFGCLAQKRGLSTQGIVNTGDEDDDFDYDYEKIARLFDVASPLAQEVMFVNDEWTSGNGPEDKARRWKTVREWVGQQIKAANPPTAPAAMV